MINVPVGVAQFCDVPPGRDAPAPVQLETAALSCCSLGCDLDVRTVAPAQVRYSDDLVWPPTALRSVAFSGPR
jgi:hypothetical protein